MYISSGSSTWMQSGLPSQPTPTGLPQVRRGTRPTHMCGLHSSHCGRSDVVFFNNVTGEQWYYYKDVVRFLHNSHCVSPGIRWEGGWWTLEFVLMGEGLGLTAGALLSVELLWDGSGIGGF